MPYQPRSLQVSFAGGEMSPEMFSRYDDVRYRSGAALIQNMITHPRGSVARRPGFGLVRETKDSNYQSRLFPFRFSTEQALVIEAGRADIQSENRGYFRFHTAGATVLQQRPPEYRSRELAVDIDLLSNNEWQLTQNQPGPSHGFQTGDPIVFTMHTDLSSLTVTFDIADNRVDVIGHAYLDDDVVVFSADVGDLPAPLEPERFYYIRDVNPAVSFAVSDVRGGPPIEFTTAGGAGPFRHAVIPRAQRIPSNEVLVLEPNRTFYAIRVNDLEIQIAETRAEALAGNFLDFDGIGTVDQGDVAVHYDYRRGATVYDGTRVNNLDAPYYLFRAAAWGEPGSRYMRLADHLGHGPQNLNGSAAVPVTQGLQLYWQEMPGKSEEVTFSLALNRVDWTAHGLPDNSPITFETTGTLPTPLVAGQVYYVRNRTEFGDPAGPDQFFLSDTPVGGGVVILSGVPSGTHTAFANGFYEVPHFYAEDTLFQLTFVQSNDVLSIAHEDKPVAELRRLGPANWELVDVTFNTTVPAPRNVVGERFQGEGQTVTSILVGTASPAQAQLSFALAHLYTAGERVTAENIEDPSGTPVYIPDGIYVVDQANLASGLTLTLKEFETGDPVEVQAGSATPAISSLAKLRSSPPFIDDEERYVVTSLDERNEESEASEEVSIRNNLLVAGAYNTISWDAVSGAQRYRIYKDVNGLFGLIGETDAPNVSFVDDNIGPDLSFTPPILDTGLRVEVPVTFDIATSPTTIFSPDHSFEDGASVVFFTNDTLPPEIVQGATYYLLNVEEDAFEISAEPDGDPITLTDPVSDPIAGEHTATSGNFPQAVTYFEQRRVFGGSRVQPQDFWMTASGTEEDLSYSIPTLDADRIQNRLAARERSEIRHAVPAGHLLFLTSAAEYRLTSLDGGPLTPGAVAARAPTQVGVSRVSPVVVNNAVIFPADRGGHLREMGFLERVSDYVTGDVSLRAAHLFDDRTVIQLAYHQAPQPIVWAVSSVGSLLGLTYIPEEQVAGWHQQTIDGSIESVSAIPEGDEDFCYTIATRNGTRYVERMGSQYVEAIEDVFFLDSGVTYKGGNTVNSVFVPHLAGRSVELLVDGVASTGTVDALGVLTLQAPATTVHVGLPYQSDLQTIPLGLQVDAAVGVGRTKNIDQVFVRVYESGPFQVGPALANLSTSRGPTTGELQTKLEQVVIVGRWDLEGQVFVRGAAPLPLIVTGVTLETATGG